MDGIKLTESQENLAKHVLTGEVNRRTAREISQRAFGMVDSRHVNYVWDVMKELINLGVVVSNGRGYYRPENTEDVKAMGRRIFAHGLSEIRRAKKLLGPGFDELRGQLTTI